MKVTAVVEAFKPVPNLSTATRPRDFHCVDAFAHSLSEALGVDVPVFEGPLTRAPSDGYLLVFGFPRDADPQLGPRSIAFDEDRSTIMKTAEAFRLAGAIEKQRYFRWCTRRSDERGDGIVGRRDVAQRIGARVMSGPYSSPHYAMLASDAAKDLVGLLATYLHSYRPALQGARDDDG